MMVKQAPIGVMDSGVGGLSVVLALQKLLPWEDIIYYGDTANCPYGNKTKEQLLKLSGNMLSFLQNNRVKCVALACNTTSALADILRPNFTVPIITVAECAADAIGRMGLSSVGLIATVSTVNSGIYAQRIHAIDKTVLVPSHGSVHLARLVEENHPTHEAVDAEIKSCMDTLLSKENTDHVILGCTHYPLVRDRFEALYPQISFLDPAPYQADYVKSFLAKEDALNSCHKPSLTIYTTGDKKTFEDICSSNGLADHYNTGYFHIDA